MGRVEQRLDMIFWSYNTETQYTIECLSHNNQQFTVRHMEFSPNKQYCVTR